MNLSKGEASAAVLAATYKPSAYNASYRTFLFRKAAVSYMNEEAVSQEIWQQLQRQIGALEERLAHLANLSEYPNCCQTCCGGDVLDAFQAVAALIKATRDVHMATVNVELAAVGAQMGFGGGNSAYYLETLKAKDAAGVKPALQEARAAEVAAREGLAKFDFAPLVENLAAPEPVVGLEMNRSAA